MCADANRKVISIHLPPLRLLQVRGVWDKWHLKWNDSFELLCKYSVCSLNLPFWGIYSSETVNVSTISQRWYEVLIKRKNQGVAHWSSDNPWESNLVCSTKYHWCMAHIRKGHIRKGGQFKKFQLVKKQKKWCLWTQLLALATASRHWYSHPLRHQRLGTLRGPWRQILFSFSFFGADTVWLFTVQICQSHRWNVCVKSGIWTCCWSKCDVSCLEYNVLWITGPVS